MLAALSLLPVIAVSATEKADACREQRDSDALASGKAVLRKCPLRGDPANARHRGGESLVGKESSLREGPRGRKHPTILAGVARLSRWPP